MNGRHPTADQLDRYRRRTAAPAELLDVDAHLASCDECHAAVRERHLTYEETEAYVDGARDAAVTDHLALCEMCRSEAADLAKMREVVVAMPRRVPWRWVAAAAAVIVAFVPLLLLRDDAPVEPPTTQPPRQQVVALARPAIVDELLGNEPVLRGKPAARTFTLEAPVATVVLDDRPTFRWTSLPAARTYTIAVVDTGGGVVATGSTTATTWRPETALPRERTYVWQVVAETSTGSVIAPGPSAAEAQFHVGKLVQVQGTPRERGIALANIGALDDAERELEKAGAADLLQQVRGWRQRALPTTTNGAQ